MISNFLAMQRMAFFIFILSLSSCSFFLNQLGDPSQDVVGLEQEKFGIVFSHNINGETHPCGCRHYPLGGLAQVAGQIKKLQGDQQIIYIDSGDTLFPGFNIPQSIDKSTTFNAKELAKGLSQAGLRYWVPGDQDFAKGLNFIEEITKETKINLLLANLKAAKNKEKIAHKEFLIFERGPHKIFITGLIEPSLLPNQYRHLFSDPDMAMRRVMDKMIKEKAYDSNNKFHRLVVVTHAGITHDEDLAKKFPTIDWIIGAHTMNFLRFPQEQGQTKMVQVLSRNHYLGHITFDLTGDKLKDSYEIHEIRDELKNEIKPNPLLSFIDKHKEALSIVQKAEQNVKGPIDPSTQNFATASSCIECHEPQGEFWRGTPHALAYQTLRQVKEENNLSCVKCHSLGLQNEKGFPNVNHIIKFDPSDSKKVLNTTEHQKALGNYWKEVDKSFGKQAMGSIRKLQPQAIRNYANAWAQVDKSKNVTHNFSNVQCLNCHSKHAEHPFDNNPYNTNPAQRRVDMQDKCLTCHDPDQSPQWYQKNEKGLAGDVNYDVLNKKMDKMTCPSTEKQ